MPDHPEGRTWKELLANSEQSASVARHALERDRRDPILTIPIAHETFSIKRPRVFGIVGPRCASLARFAFSPMTSSVARQWRIRCALAAGHDGPHVSGARREFFLWTFCQWPATSGATGAYRHPEDPRVLAPGYVCGASPTEPPVLGPTTRLRWRFGRHPVLGEAPRSRKKRAGRALAGVASLCGYVVASIAGALFASDPGAAAVALSVGLVLVVSGGLARRWARVAPRGRISVWLGTGSETGTSVLSGCFG